MSPIFGVNIENTTSLKPPLGDVLFQGFSTIIFLPSSWSLAEILPSFRQACKILRFQNLQFKNPTRQAGSFYGSHSSNMFAFLEPDTPLKFDHLKRIFILQPPFFRLNVKLQDTSGVYLAQQNHFCHLQTNQAMCTSAWLQVLKHV